MRKLAIVFLLAGCQSNALQQVNSYTSGSNNDVYTASPEMSREELAKKITSLNSAGVGSVKVCSLDDFSSSINIFYSNEIGKKLVVRVYDEHIINSVSIYTNKQKTNDLLLFVEDLERKAKENRELEKLYLGKFSAGSNWVMFNSRYGSINGFWGNDRVDRVLTSIDPQYLHRCIKSVEPYL
ncbi:hypothetical protein ACM8C1_004703 [Vibrio parahaemolyticus]